MRKEPRKTLRSVDSDEEPPVASETRTREELLAAADLKAREQRPKLIENVRADIRRHGGVFLTRSVIGLSVFRLGAWALAQPGHIRRPAMRVYGLMERATRAFTGIHMHCTVRVGEAFHIVHAEGSISIHPDVVIGDRVGIMHNVTLGMNMTDPGLPIIGNDVFIGTGAVILGPVVVGDGAIIAANSLVISDVPPNSTAIGVPARSVPRIAPKQPPKGTIENERSTTRGALDGRAKPESGGQRADEHGLP